MISKWKEYQGINPRLWKLLHLLHHFAIHRVFTIDGEREQLDDLRMSKADATALAAKFHKNNPYFYKG